jgi:DMSO/TMAO reductase YedYZ molybdopterin-dependent catalytic subunit
MEAMEGWGGFMTSVGTINGPSRYTGVSIADLLAAVGGLDEGETIRVSAEDGYTMTFSHSQTNGKSLIVFDGISGEEVEAPELTLIAAYAENGQPIAEEIGPLRLGILSDERTVTEGHWWLKWFNRIEVVPDIVPWTLHLEGGTVVDMDNGTFESCAGSAGCHGVSWPDGNGVALQGVPLWRLAGYADDDLMHLKLVGFNDELAEAGYEISIIAGDGYTVKLNSKEVARNQDIIVAFQADGAPLGEEDWPLRLVGDGLTKGQMVSRITSIKLSIQK